MVDGAQMLAGLGDDRRGVSPVIGAVLMVGIFVLLMAVIGAFVFAFSPAQASPNAQFEFVEGHAGGGSGIGVAVFLDLGDSLDEANIQLQIDGQQCNGWEDDGQISMGEGTFIDDCDGEIDVGDELQVIWSNGGQSAILATHEVRDPGPLSACAQLRYELSNNQYAEVTEEINCDVGSESDPVDSNIDIVSGGGIIGDVHLGGDRGELELRDGSYIDADSITVGDQLQVLDGSHITGEIEALDVVQQIEIEDGSRVEGTLTSGERVLVNMGSEVDGNINAEGEVEVLDGSDVYGDVCSEDAITVGGSSEIHGAENDFQSSCT